MGFTHSIALGTRSWSVSRRRPFVSASGNGVTSTERGDRSATMLWRRQRKWRSIRIYPVDRSSGLEAAHEESIEILGIPLDLKLTGLIFLDVEGWTKDLPLATEEVR